jgi:putative transcriptional regulator
MGDDSDVDLDDEDNPEWTDANTRPLDDGEKLQVVRVRLRLSQAAMARLLRIPLSTLRNWEQHRTKPDGPARTLIALLYQDPAGMRARLEQSAA